MMLNMVFSFSAHRDIAHLSSLWLIPLVEYLSCMALKFIFCFIFFFFFFFLGGGGGGKLCGVRIF